MCEPWQDPPQDHPKGLVHGTRIAICSDKDSFHPLFCTRTQLYVLTNSVGLTQKIKDQALILKLGKSTSQEINPNCRLRVPGTFGNWESRQLSAHYAVGKRKKNNPPLFRVVRVEKKVLHCGKSKKKWLLSKRDDIKCKKVKRFAIGSCTFSDQFLANLVRVWCG